MQEKLAENNALSLKDICVQAMEKGEGFDLSDCVYGETNGCCPFIGRPTSYYYFLAGFVNSQRLSSVLEIGTHYGGSIMSMSRGMPPETARENKLVTIDITYKNEDGFRRFPHIKRVCGDALDSRVIAEAKNSFKGPIDLLYIDSEHEYEHTKRCIAIYAGALDPRYLIIDDIQLFEPMRRLWDELTERFQSRAFNAAEICRRRNAGFGVIRWRV